MWATSYSAETACPSRKRGHGIGLPSVAATVKRYNGTLSVTAKDGVFGVNILLSL